MYGHNCGDENQKTFRNNVAHSIQYSTVGGHGALIYQSSNNGACMEASYFTAYKCMQTGFSGGAHPGSEKVIVRKMTIIDNVQGFSGSMVSSGLPDSVMPEVEINDNIIYGKSEIPDCPPGGGYCFEGSKGAYVATGMLEGAASLHPTMPVLMPYHKGGSEGAWKGTYKLFRNTFRDFVYAVPGAGRNAMIMSNPEGPDFQQQHWFYDNKFINTDQNFLAWAVDPQPGWANIGDCGNYPCTAPKNILWKFKNNHWSGADTKYTNPPLGSDFQVIHNNTEFAPHISNCNAVEDWNGYSCQKPHLGQLVFESMDLDKMDRSMQPVYVQLQGTDMNNNLNAYMDHCWDGFYTCQKRLQRFVSVVDGEPGMVYNITFTGSPAKTMRFRLGSENPATGMTIRIAYPSAESRSMSKGGKLISFN